MCLFYKRARVLGLKSDNKGHFVKLIFEVIFVGYFGTSSYENNQKMSSLTKRSEKRRLFSWLFSLVEFIFFVLAVAK